MNALGHLRNQKIETYFSQYFSGSLQYIPIMLSYLQLRNNPRKDHVFLDLKAHICEIETWLPLLTSPVLSIPRTYLPSVAEIHCIK